MIETKKARELDVVELIEDLPEFGLRRGERGTVVEAFDYPDEAYILEFVDASGLSSRLAYGVKPSQIETIEPFARGRVDRVNGRELYLLDIHVGGESSDEELSAVADSFNEGFRISIQKNLYRFSENLLPFALHLAIGAVASGVFYDLLKTAVFKLTSKPEIKRNFVIKIKKHSKEFVVTKDSYFMRERREEKTFQSIDDLFDNLKQD